MTSRSLFRRSTPLAAALLFGIGLSGCASGESGTGSNTNWLTCESDPDCPSGNLCFEGQCEKLEAEPCAEGARVAIENVNPPLQARQGSYFAGTMYVPVEGAAADVAQNIVPAAIVARVRDGSGAALGGCTVTWRTSKDGGWVYPSSVTSDNDGTISAAWIAGLAADEELTVAVVDEAGVVSSARLAGEVLPHDAEPLSDGGPTTTGPTGVMVSASLSDGVDALRIRVLPITAPHHSFYVAAALPGFFTGLQNTSDDDAFAVDVPAEERVLLASVWNTDTDPAQILWNAPDVPCGPHTQDQGGQQCNLPDAWEPGAALTITVEMRTLASGEAAPPEYADLGYVQTACESAAGCLDYTVFTNKDGEAPVRMVAYRYPSADAVDWLLSYIDPYVVADSQTSCLLTPKYEVEYTLEESVAKTFAPLLTALETVSYDAGNNAICANNGATTSESSFVLWTGGSEINRVRPLRPGEADPVLEAKP